MAVIVYMYSINDDNGEISNVNTDPPFVVGLNKKKEGKSFYQSLIWKKPCHWYNNKIFNNHEKVVHGHTLKNKNVHGIVKCLP